MSTFSASRASRIWSKVRSSANGPVSGSSSGSIPIAKFRCGSPHTRELPPRRKAVLRRVAFSLGFRRQLRQFFAGHLPHRLGGQHCKSLLLSGSAVYTKENSTVCHDRDRAIIGSPPRIPNQRFLARERNWICWSSTADVVAASRSNGPRPGLHPLAAVGDGRSEPVPGANPASDSSAELATQPNAEQKRVAALAADSLADFSTRKRKGRPALMPPIHAPRAPRSTHRIDLRRTRR